MKKGNIFFAVIIVLIIAVVITNCTNKKKDNSNDIKNTEVQEANTEEMIKTNESEAITDSSTEEPKLNTKKEEIKDVPVNNMDEKEISEKFIEAMLVLRSGKSNEVAMNRLKNITTPQYFEKMKIIFDGRDDIELLNIKEINAEEHLEKTKSMPKGYKAMRVNYVGTIKYPDGSIEEEVMTYVVYLKQINNKYLVSSMAV